VPGIDWKLSVDREQAARFGTDIATIGSTIQLITNGILISEYRPDDADDEVDIRVRFPERMRTISQLDNMIVNTAAAIVPIGNFVTRSAATRVGNIERTDGVRTYTIEADVPDGVLTDDKVAELEAWFAATTDWDPTVGIRFKGEVEDQAEAEAFLTRAFLAALFLMAIILVTQFNSFYQALLILTAVLFSTVGVLIGLLITDPPFGIVMSGIGVIALAGIVVNNNIVLIDTYNRLRAVGAEAYEAAVLTCSQRLRRCAVTWCRASRHRCMSGPPMANPSPGRPALGCELRCALMRDYAFRCQHRWGRRADCHSAPQRYAPSHSLRVGCQRTRALRRPG
jgi:multidrug efflux pump